LKVNGKSFLFLWEMVWVKCFSSVNITTFWALELTSELYEELGLLGSWHLSEQYLYWALLKLTFEWMILFPNFSFISPSFGMSNCLGFTALWEIHHTGLAFGTSSGLLMDSSARWATHKRTHLTRGKTRARLLLALANRKSFVRI